MHYFGTFLDSGLAANPTYGQHSHEYTEAVLVDDTSGSVHTGLSIAQLGAGGTLSPHVHSYEEGFYILSGEVIAGINDQTYRLGPGDYGCIKVGTIHAWRNDASTPVRWLQHAAPQPKPPGTMRDTFFPKHAGMPDDGAPLDPADPRQPAEPLRRQPDSSRRQTMVTAGLKGVFPQKGPPAQVHLAAVHQYPPGVGSHRTTTYEEVLI
jgi:quercetin dioxygenase-like cupin family protein